MPYRAVAASAVRSLCDADPRRAAAFLSELTPQEAAALLREMPDSAARRLFDHLDPAKAGAVLSQGEPEAVAAVLAAVEPAAAADAFRAMAPETRARAIESLPETRRRELQELLSFPEDSAGRLMRTDLVSFPEGTKVRGVVQRLKTLSKRNAVPTYAYVTGTENKLRGILSMRDLLLASPEASVESIMSSQVAAVSAFMDREPLVQLVMEKRYIAVPVVDGQGRLIGAVRASDLLGESQEEAAEDIQILFGGSPEEKPFSTVPEKVRNRLPWLNVNLATAFLAGSVVAMFEDLIARVSVLAVFLPIIAGMGGNSGTQTLAVTIRGLVMREIRPADARRSIPREAAVGLLNGLVLGVVTAIAAWLWKGNPWLGLVVGLSMVVNLIAASAAGAAIPLAMKRLGFDPAQSSGIFLTTVTDVVGFFSFLGFATLFLQKLL